MCADLPCVSAVNGPETGHSSAINFEACQLNHVLYPAKRNMTLRSSRLVDATGLQSCVLQAAHQHQATGLISCRRE